MFKLDLEEAEEPEIKLILDRAREFQKNIYFCFITLKPLPIWITKNCGKFLKRWEYQITLTASWETCMQVRKQQLELDGTTDGFQIGKGVYQGCTLSPCLFNLYSDYIMRNARLGKAQPGIKIARRNINNLRYADDNTLMAESEEEPFDQGERGE